jgi:hypothetical protein
MNSGIRTLLLIMLLLSGTVANIAQQTFEPPKIEHANDLCELRAENRVFVQAPLNARGEIVKELRKHSDLFIVERPEEAAFFIFAYTSFAEGQTGGFLGDTNGATARVELAVVKFVNYREDQVRPRVLFYWSDQKSVRSVTLPLSSMSGTGFTRPHSNRGAVEELIVRLALWGVGKKWPNTFYFDQFSNQLTISTSGKLETKGAKAFLKELKNARSDSYAYRCVTSPTLAMPANAIPPRLSPLDMVPVLPAKVLTLPDELLQVQPIIQSRPRYSDGQPLSIKRTKKGRRIGKQPRRR